MTRDVRFADSVVVVVLALFAWARAAGAQDAVPPREVKVLPVFFVPKGEPLPSADQQKQLKRHLDWSQARYLVHHELLPSENVGKVTYDGNQMWHSGESAAGWVSVTLTFPFAVELTGMAIHSQHSGVFHAARAVRIAAQASNKQFQQLVETNLRSVDDRVTFATTSCQVWRLELQAGESKFVVVRGLQFYSGADELFPPLLPWPR